LAAEKDQSKQQGTSLKSAFGTNDVRKLDNTSPGVVANPAPNQYLHPIRLSPKNPHKNSSTFLNNVSRFSDAAKNMISPSPSTYDTTKYNSLGSEMTQGGAPNNILTLRKAENKFIQDQLFPFLVRDRLQAPKSQVESADLGPGKYETITATWAPTGSAVRHKNYNNTSQQRFASDTGRE
jgi:hypothetical protein